MRWKSIAIPLCLVAALSHAALADTVKLKNGDVLTGKVVSVLDGKLTLKTDAAALDKVVGLGTDILFVGLSREDELEADSLGTAYAAQAGYDPTGLLRFVQKLQTNESKPFMASLKATHPKPKDRIKLLERVTGKTPGAGGAPVVLADRYKSSTASVPR